MPSLNQNVKKSHHKLRRRRTRNKIKGGALRLPRLAALRQSTPIVAEEDARGMGNPDSNPKSVFVGLPIKISQITPDDDVGLGGVYEYIPGYVNEEGHWKRKSGEETMHLYISITGDWVFRAFVHSDSPGCKAYRKRVGLPTDILPLGRFNWIFMQPAGTDNIEIELILEQDLENLPGVKAGLPITISQVTDNVKIIDIEGVWNTPGPEVNNRPYWIKEDYKGYLYFNKYGDWIFNNKLDLDPMSVLAHRKRIQKEDVAPVILPLGISEWTFKVPSEHREVGDDTIVSIELLIEQEEVITPDELPIAGAGGGGRRSRRRSAKRKRKTKRKTKLHGGSTYRQAMKEKRAAETQAKQEQEVAKATQEALAREAVRKTERETAAMSSRDPIYTCEVCNVSFANNTELSAHLETSYHKRNWDNLSTGGGEAWIRNEYIDGLYDQMSNQTLSLSELIQIAIQFGVTQESIDALPPVPTLRKAFKIIRLLKQFVPEEQKSGCAGTILSEGKHRLREISPDLQICDVCGQTFGAPGYPRSADP